jgi:HprK-related kinase B
MQDPEIKKFIEGTLERHSCRERLFIGIGELIIQVKSNSEALTEELRRYYQEFLCWESHEDILIHAIETPGVSFPIDLKAKEPDPGKSRIKEEFADLADGRIVKKRLTGLWFLFNGWDNLAVGPCLANPNQIVNFINNRFIEKMLRGGGLLAHAAGVCSGNRGLAIAGFSGRGKSSLALHLLGRGTSFVSNDRLMLARRWNRLHMFGIPKHPRVNPGTILSIPQLRGVIKPQEREAYIRLNPDELWTLERKYDVLIDEIFGSKRFQLSAIMEGLLLLNWRRDGGDFAIRPADIDRRRDLLTAFIKPPGLFFLPEELRTPLDFSPERYIEGLAGCQVFEAVGGIDFEGATAFCMAFLERRDPC